MNPPPMSDLVYVHLPLGRDNAKTIGQIQEALGISRRAVERAIEELRQNGEAVCSGSDGVWITRDPGELRAQYRALRRRYIRQAVNARVLLRTAARFDKVQQQTQGGVMKFRCTGCGGSSIELNAAHPSLDDRYPLGHCVRCTPWPAQKRNPMKPQEMIQPPRKTIALIRSDLFDQADFDHRKKVEEARRLASKLTSKSLVRMGDAELVAAREAADCLMRETA